MNNQNNENEEWLTADEMIARSRKRRDDKWWRERAESANFEIAVMRLSAIMTHRAEYGIPMDDPYPESVERALGL